MQYCQKSNDDNIEKQEPAEEIFIPPEKKRRNQSLPGKNSACTVIRTSGKIYVCDVV